MTDADRQRLVGLVTARTRLHEAAALTRAAAYDMQKDREDRFIERCKKEFGTLTWESELLLRYAYAAGANELGRAAFAEGNDPIGVALTKVGLERRPVEVAVPSKPRLVYPPMTPEQVAALTAEELLTIYCRTMHEIADVFIKYETCVVRGWDGMDGCWTDCTGEVGRDEALRVWAERTDGGAHRVGYAEIDYYRIFPGGTRMNWDGSEGREMNR